MKVHTIRVEPKSLRESATVEEQLPCDLHALDIRQAILEATETDRLDEVRTLLGERGGMHQSLQYDRKPGKTCIGCPLTYATKLGHVDLIKMLLEGRANPDSEYSFDYSTESGKGSLTLPAVAAAIGEKQHEIFKLLHEGKASIDSDKLPDKLLSHRDTNWNLLYEASYHGCLPIIHYLRKNSRTFKEDLIAEVKQRNMDRWRNPLHCAVWKGHLDVVEGLLQLGAPTKTCEVEARGKSWTMLPAFVDASEKEDLQMVILLVKLCVNAFEGKPGKRCIDYVFEKSNSIMLAAVVAGLQCAAKSKDRFSGMQATDLLKIMLRPNCDAIFDAIFREKSISDWEGEDKITISAQRVRLFTDPIVLSVSEGRSSDGLAQLDALFKAAKKEQGNGFKEQKMYRAFKKFTETLLPGRKARARGVGPISIKQCVLPNVHTSPMLAYALANRTNNEIFDHPGAQAFVKHMWEQNGTWYSWNFACNFAMALLFLGFAFLINKDAKRFTRYILGSCAAVLWIRNLVLECLEMAGTCWLGSQVAELRGAEVTQNFFLTAYLLNFGNWFDMMRICLTGFGIVLIFRTEEFGVNDSMALRTVLGFVMFLLWTKVLLCQRGFEFIGTKMLPIQVAVGATWPLLSMMLWPAIGFAQGYFVLGVYPEFFRAMTLVYRAGFVSDFDVEEIEDIDPTFVPDDDGLLEVEDPEWTEYHVVYIFFMVAVTLAFTIIMMNVLIGVLSEAYHTAYADRHRLFLQSRASISFEALAAKCAWNNLCAKLPCYVVCCGRNKMGMKVMRDEDDGFAVKLTLGRSATFITSSNSASPALRRSPTFITSSNSEDNDCWVRILTEDEKTHANNGVSQKNVATKTYLWYCQSTVIRPRFIPVDRGGETLARDKEREISAISKSS